VLTFDLDFGDILAAALSEAPSVIIFRLRNQTPDTVNPRLFHVIGDCKGELASSAIIIVEDEGYRVRRLPIRH
jgi:predicted nuclease of predicted toxin-antitoxin system